MTAARWLRRRLAPRRQVFIDCGSNNCKVLEARILSGKREFFAFEPQPQLATKTEELSRKYPLIPIHFFDKAVWVFNGTIDFYLATN